MKSSSGQYYIGLDHVRAVAVLMVFSWHFITVQGGHLAPPPTFPLSLLSEGHTGVAIFMALSGYLFAKLLDGKRINYAAFIWNRFLRLAPLLFLVLAIAGVRPILAGSPLSGYLQFLLHGAVAPTLPNGGWSITVEFHFYLLLPLLLFLKDRWQSALLIVLIMAWTLRNVLHSTSGSVQMLSYFTIIGRLDQFLFGILAYQFRDHARGQHLLAGAVVSSFVLFFWYFDSVGGFYRNQAYPSPSELWVYMPMIEGFTYAFLIAWYDASFRHPTGRISRFVASIGTYSYSIYLLHFFIVFRLASFIDGSAFDLSNLHVALLFSIPCFFVMWPIGAISYRMIELPFLRYRMKYILPPRSPSREGR